MKTQTKTWPFASSSSNKTYTTILWEDGSLSCNCNGWTILRKGATERSCTHTKQVAAELGAAAGPAMARSSTSTEAPKPATKAQPLQIAARNTPPSVAAAKFFKPMLAHLHKEVLGSLDPLSVCTPLQTRWIAEPKFDGERMTVFVEDGKTVAAFSRLGNVSLSKNGLEWVRDVAWPVRSAILDGEACANGGLCIAGKTVDAGHSGAGLIKDYVIFDLLSLNGEDLKQQTWQDRRSLLEKHFGDFKADGHISITPYTDDAAALWSAWVEKLNGEGIMIKERSSRYVDGWRSPHWLKVPMECDIDVVITGFTDKATYNGGKCYRTSEGAHTFGYFNPETNQYVTVGQGIPGTKAEILSNIKKVAVMKCKGVTQTGALRSGRFLRWRDDKAPEECTMPRL